MGLTRTSVSIARVLLAVATCLFGAMYGICISVDADHFKIHLGRDFRRSSSQSSKPK